MFFPLEPPSYLISSYLFYSKVHMDSSKKECTFMKDQVNAHVHTHTHTQPSSCPSYTGDLGECIE